MIYKSHLMKTIYQKNKPILKVNKNVFIPTGTSNLLIEACQKIVRPKKKILDLGCGCGIVGISIAKKLKIKSKIFFSDISNKACKNTLINCKRLNINSEVRVGPLLEPWKNKKFDYIISDVAAISAEISKISPWYKNCVNNSGYDGSDHIINIISNSKKYLHKNGKLIFPIISLSNEKKIKSNLKKNFKKIKKISSQTWPMPKSISKKILLLNKLKKNKIISFESKLGLLTFRTDIYSAK